MKQLNYNDIHGECCRSGQRQGHDLYARTTFPRFVIPTVCIYLAEVQAGWGCRYLIDWSFNGGVVKNVQRDELYVDVIQTPVRNPATIH